MQLITNNANYAHLQILLAANQWQQADEETRKTVLKIVKECRKVDKLSKSDAEWMKKLDYFRSGDTETFPCDDLLIIDNLWAKYSESKFSFSPQSEIWQEVNHDYNKFAEQVGWLIPQQQNNWYLYHELNFSLKAPKGHLPAGLFYTSEGLATGYAATISLKISECKTAQNKQC